MIDTIHLQYDFRSHKEQIDCIEKLKDRFAVDFFYRETSDNSKVPLYHCRCWDSNFKIWVINNQFHIEGSLNKLYHGNNVQQLKISDLQDAIDLFKNRYSEVDWNLAIVRRIDLAVNIELSVSPSLLNKKLIGAKRMRKSTVSSNSESVTIGNNSNSIIFYNKSVEYANKKRNNVLEVEVPDNLLRIECRITGKYPMKNYFKTETVTLLTVIERRSILPEIWFSMYSNVQKDYSTSIDLFSNRKEMEMKLIIFYGVENLMAQVNDSYNVGKLTIDTKRNLLRHLRMISIRNKELCKTVDILRELDAKVQSIKF